MFCLCVPFVSKAALIISEVAWMGSAASANHEWIELHNTGSSVDVSGWTLTDGMNLTITLAGTVPAGGYVVLERSSDDSAPGTAFLMYTGALVNTGATLQLKRTDSALEDQVAGGENWQGIGGDNVTKETAQYTTAGWVTGVATPGAANAGTPQNNEEENDDENDTDNTTNETTATAKRNSSSETVRLVLRDVSLQLAVTSQSVGYVNQSIEFLVTPSGVGEVLVDSLQYDWNFGDGTTAHGKETAHVFMYPGRYVVTVYGGYKRQEQVARHEITILPVALSLTKNTKGDVQINNNSPYEIDISGYAVEGKKRFVFPKYSVILPNQTVTIPKVSVGSAPVRLKDALGILVTNHSASSRVTGSSETPISGGSVTPVLVAPESTTPQWYAPLLDPQTYDLVKTAAASTTQALSQPQVGGSLSTTTTGARPLVPKDAWPYLGLIAVILLGLFGTAHKITRNQSD